MSGAKEADLAKVLEAEINTKIDTSKQNILDNGLANAGVRIELKEDDGSVRFSLDATASAGVQQNESDIKQSIIGKKKNEVETILRQRPGVQEVEVEYSPFWVNTVPKNEGKITIIFEKQNTESNE